MGEIGGSFGSSLGIAFVHQEFQFFIHHFTKSSLLHWMFHFFINPSLGLGFHRVRIMLANSLRVGSPQNNGSCTKDMLGGFGHVSFTS
jgi:hypothetical protein